MLNVHGAATLTWRPTRRMQYIWCFQSCTFCDASFAMTSLLAPRPPQVHNAPTLTCRTLYCCLLTRCRSCSTFWFATPAPPSLLALASNISTGRLMLNVTFASDLCCSHTTIACSPMHHIHYGAICACIVTTIKLICMGTTSCDGRRGPLHAIAHQNASLSEGAVQHRIK